jgi:hypothetical protein
VDDARIGDDAYIVDDARIGDDARIVDDARPIIVYIAGSRHFVSYWGDDKIAVGGKEQTISEWLEKGKDAGEKQGYNEAQLAE